MTTREWIKADWPALLVVALPFIVLASVWDRLPDTLPVHWNMYGEADRFEEKGFGLWAMPLVGLGMYLMMLVIPWLDPKRRIDPTQRAVRAFRLIIPALMAGVFGIICLSWLGTGINTGSAIYLLLSVLFLVMGNFMTAIKPNYFMGIRTPWTLESPDNWRQTHLLAGRLWVFGSLAMILLWFIVPGRAHFWLFMAGVLVMSIVPVGYSLYLHLADRRATRDNA